MQNPQMPRERIKRPEVYNPPVDEIIDDSEGLSQDDLNEWLTQKVIRLELASFRKEASEVRPQQHRQPIPLEKEDKKTKHQPYEDMYGSQEVVKPKKVNKSNLKTLLIFIAIIGIAYLLLQVCLYLFAGYSLPAGS
jgi:hypothetical protein